MLKKLLPLLAAAIAIGSVTACSEKLEAGKSCPLLCPEQAVTLLDTTLDAIAVDTTIIGLPPIGSEGYLMLASHGDTLDTRAIIRFDTLPQTYAINSVDSTIVTIDSALLVTPLAPDSLRRPTSPVTIEVYDVDTTATDTVSSILLSLFRPDRLLGSKTYAPESLLVDSLYIPISTDSVLDRVKNGTRLRVGLRLISSTGGDLPIGTSEGGEPVMLHVVASTDTGAIPDDIAPISNTPVNEPFLSGPLADYTIIAKGQTTNQPDILGAGGVPSRRTYIKFNVPAYIVDSTTVVRAALLLTQTPNRRVDSNDSIYVYPQAVLSAPIVTDPATALGFLDTPGEFGMDSLLIAPADSGVRSFELAGLVRTWKQESLAVSPRSIGIRSGGEGQLPGEFDFFSTNAPVGLRPRLRITYVPQTSYGIP